MTFDATEGNPYLGPRAFHEQDRHLFYGREHQALQLLSLIIARPVVLLYSPSGAGKSSLLNARIIPGLLEEGFQVLPVARLGSLIPPGIESANIYVFSTLSCWDKGQKDSRELAQQTLSSYLEGLNHPIDDLGDTAPRVAIWDQFEEFFTLHPDRWKEREDFFKQLAAALQADPLLRAVLCMREEYLGQVDPYTPLLPERMRARLRLELLDPEAAREALTKPLARAGKTFAPGVAERVVDDLLRVKVMNPNEETVEVMGQYVEPLQLQVVARSLWDGLPADTTVIRMQDLRRFGDTNQALSGFYEQVIRQVTEQAAVPEKLLREWFEYKLITPAGTRGTLFRGYTETAGLSNTAVNILEQFHIIRAEWRAGARWYELTHDRLIQPIQLSNQHWLESAKSAGRRRL